MYTNLSRNNSHKLPAVILVSLVWVMSFSLAHADTKPVEIPQPLAKALSSYKQDGIRGFITTLVDGSPLEGNQEMRTQVAILEKIEQFYGPYQSYEVLQVNPLSNSTRLVYFLLNYQKGPVFGRLTAFNNGGRETITSFEFHTKAEKALPEALLVSH